MGTLELGPRRDEWGGRSMMRASKRNVGNFGGGLELGDAGTTVTALKPLTQSVRIQLSAHDLEHNVVGLGTLPCG